MGRYHGFQTYFFLSVCVHMLTFGLFVSGSSHSDKELDSNTPEKIPRTPSERKRKRKTEDTGGTGKGVRTGGGGDNKKVSDYLIKHSGNSPIRHGGAKSPSPQQPPYPMVSNVQRRTCS